MIISNLGPDLILDTTGTKVSSELVKPLSAMLGLPTISLTKSDRFDIFA